MIGSQDLLTSFPPVLRKKRKSRGWSKKTVRRKVMIITSSEIELEVEEIFLERVPAEEYSSRKYDNFLLHLVGKDDKTQVELSEAEFLHLRGVLE